MSSSEQAPEPTMDEILASIRKIISDDETEDGAQPEVAAAEPATPAGDGLADDLANALNDTQGADAQSTAEVPEDILDLTQVVAEQLQDAAPQEDAVQPAADPDPALAMPEAAEAPAMPEASAALEASMASEATAGESDITALLAEAGVLETVDEAAAEPQASAPPDGDALNAAMGEMDTAAADPAPAQEMPISEALSAIEMPAAEAAPGAEPQSQDASFDADLVQTAEPDPQAPAEPGDAFAPEASELAAALEAPDAEVDAELDAEVQTDAEFGVQMPESDAEVAQADVSLAGEAPAEGEAPVMDAPADSEGEAAVEDETSEAEAPAAAAAGEVRTLEDSVKEMLRPMLREWLDDNMERIVQDEVASTNLKGGDS